MKGASLIRTGTGRVDRARACSLLVLAALLLSRAAECRGQSLPPLDEHDVVLEPLPEPPTEGLLLGNGNLGVSVHGGRRLVLTLGRSDLWDHRPPSEFQTDEFTVETLRRAVESGDSRTLERVFEAPFERSAWPCRLPVARIVLEFPPGMGPLSARLSLARAEVEIKLEGGGVVEVFVDAERELGRLRVRNAIPARVLLQPAGSDQGDPSDLSLARLGYPECETDDRNWASWMRQEVFGGQRFAVSTRTLDTGAAWELLFAVTPPMERDPLAAAGELLASARNSRFEEHRREHREWWRRFWSASGIRLPERERALETQWYRSQYLLGCSVQAGMPAPSCSGPWSFSNDHLPDQKGTYSLSTEFIWSLKAALGANHPQLARAVLEWIASLRQQARTYTRLFYGLEDGWNLPSVIAMDGRPAGGFAAHAFSETTSALLACGLLEYSDQVDDESFDQRVVIPLVTDAISFQEAQLTHGADGLRRPRTSSSPEMFEGGLDAFLPSPSNADLAVLRAMLQGASALALRRSIDGLGERSRALEESLPAFAQEEHDGRFLLAPGMDVDHSHRWFSHLFAFHPFTLRSPCNDSTPALIASLRHLDQRGAAGWVGTSFAWRAALAARAGDGATAARALQIFSEAFVLRNGLHSGGDLSDRAYSAIQDRAPGLDGNFAAADALQTMLVHVQDGEIRVLLGIPELWQNVQFRQLRVAGGFLVGARRTAGSISEVEVSSERGGPCRLRVPFSRRPWLTDGDTADILPFEVVDGAVEFATKRGRSYTLREGPPSP